MKKLITIVLLITSILSFGQGKQSFNSFNNGFKIDLKLNESGHKNKERNRNTEGVVLLIAGVAFTTAAILEDDMNYGTYTPYPMTTGNYKQTYVKKPFWEQTPRQIMLVVGVGFTITGGVLMIKG